jgi:alanine dehydrogenase
MAHGLRADVTVIDRSLPRLRALDVQFHGVVQTLYSTADTIEKAVIDADLVIGAVLVPGAAAPKLVTEAMIKRMRPGSVVVDIAIDQGGCFATSRPTTHADPVYVLHGVTHYCVTNMPGAVARSSAQALTNATLPYVKALADKGWKQALAEDAGLAAGLNVSPGISGWLEIRAYPAAALPAASRHLQQRLDDFAALGGLPRLIEIGKGKFRDQPVERELAPAPIVDQQRNE